MAESLGEAPIIRKYADGIGDAVANRTINRKIQRRSETPFQIHFELPRQDNTSLDDQLNAYAKSQGMVFDSYKIDSGDGETVSGYALVCAEIETENWGDVAERVAKGNSQLEPDRSLQEMEFKPLYKHIAQASLLMSGRHLQHGDETQASRNIEVFTNCATSALSSLSFYLLLNGSGVGRAYDDEMMAVDWANMPQTVSVIDSMHPDVLSGEIVSLDKRSAEHLYYDRKIHTVVVEDSREGWAKAIEEMEAMAFVKTYKEDVLLLDFSKVRCKGSPIGGMQDRPASGPGPVMSAIPMMNAIRDAGMERWRQAMYIDHYLAEIVLVGGARRAARMATKNWRDKNVIDFINIKRPIEFYGKTGEEIEEMRKTGYYGAFLWTSNNSVTVDAEFWRYIKEGCFDGNTELALHAQDVLTAATEASYYDGTGEPAFINQDKLTGHNTQVDYSDGMFADSERYSLNKMTLELTKDLAKRFAALVYKMITNPCGEISLSKLGGYCVIADVVPYFAGGASRELLMSSRSGLAEARMLGKAEIKWHESEWDKDAEDAFRVATRALIRTNLMDALYGPELKRTNRIGVGMTGLHEWIYARFGYGWKDIIDEEKSKDMWLTLSRFKRSVVEEGKSYSASLGVVAPHTDTTMKPAGTTSKLFSLSEGAHLASMREYLRWVQFRNDDPLIEDYREMGYPIRELTSYKGTTIVGFPTRPEICSLGMGDKLVTAGEATPEEQYQYLRLLEKYWILGVEEDGVTALAESGNQVSYTLKYNPKTVSYAEFTRTLIDGQSSIRCCSVMPQEDSSAYEYTPEEGVTAHEYQAIVDGIKRADGINEDIGFEHVDCGTGGCPISFDEPEVAAA